MNTKQIIKKTWLYDLFIAYLNYKKRKHNARLAESFLREGEAVLRLFSEALFSENIKFWLDYGTLLGYHREHDFIKHDTDIDTGAFIEDAERIEKVLKSHGFRLVRYYRNQDGSGIEHCYCKEGFSTTIDVFYYKRDEKSVTCYSYYPFPHTNIEKNLFKEIPFTTFSIVMPFSGLKETTFKGIKVYVPIEIEDYLVANYGPHYMIPDPDFNPFEATNIRKYTYEEKPAIGYLEIPY